MNLKVDARQRLCQAEEEANAHVRHGAVGGVQSNPCVSGPPKPL